MNETTATSASGLSLLPDGIATLTTIHFAIIAVLAVLVVIGLLWGIRAKRSRVQASRDVIANAEEAGVAPEPIVEDRPSSDAVADERTMVVEPAAKPAGSQAQTQTRSPTPAPAPSPPPVVEASSTGGSDAEAPTQSGRLTDEPVAAKSPLEAGAATEPTAPAQAPASSPPPSPAQTYADDPVTQLKGLGPKVAARLGELGVTTIGEMAALSDGQAQSIDAQLGAFTGRMSRDRWIEQARLLAAGDKAGFEAVFGKL